MAKQKNKESIQSINLTIPNFPFGDIRVYQNTLINFNSRLDSVVKELVYNQIQVADRPIEPKEEREWCGKGFSWSFSGYQRTLVNGTAVIDLNELLNCVDEPPDAPIPDPAPPTKFSVKTLQNLSSFIATANTDQPIFLTYTRDRFIITVRSWNSNGTRAKNIDFSWTACAQATIIAI